jgi:hypothetical protein
MRRSPAPPEESILDLAHYVASLGMPSDSLRFLIRQTAVLNCVACPAPSKGNPAIKARRTSPILRLYGAGARARRDHQPGPQRPEMPPGADAWAPSAALVAAWVYAVAPGRHLRKMTPA